MVKPSGPARQPTIVDGTIVYDNISLNVPNLFIQEIRGRGANAVVFGGRDTMLDRAVVAKLYLPNKGDRRDKRTQALAEARKLAKLRHPNIVNIFGVYPHKAGPVLVVMERLEGQNLKEYLSESRNLAERSELWEDIYRGLKYAHRQGVLHGDLHWKNVVIHEGHAVLIDFGTSVFESCEGQSRDREVRMPRELLKRLFAPEGVCVPRRSSLSGMTPDESLFGCDKAHELLLCQQQVTAVFQRGARQDWGQVLYSLDDYRQRGALLSLAIVVSEFPFFPLETIISWLRGNAPEAYQSFFYDSLKSLLQMRGQDQSAVTTEYQLDEAISVKIERVASSMAQVRRAVTEGRRIIASDNDALRPGWR